MHHTFNYEYFYSATKYGRYSVYADAFQIIIPRHNPFLSKNLFIKITLCFALTSITPHNDCHIIEMIACRKKNTELRA